jgi:hypothetical protein
MMSSAAARPATASVISDTPATRNPFISVPRGQDVPYDLADSVAISITDN